MTDWAEGDRCVCVHGWPWSHWNTSVLQPGPVSGQILIVDSVMMPPLVGEVFLGFAAWRPRHYYHRHFRRIEPHEPDADDEEVIRIYRGEYIRTPAPAT